MFFNYFLQATTNNHLAPPTRQMAVKNGQNGPNNQLLQTTCLQSRRNIRTQNQDPIVSTKL
jgi:hypothetical protein